MERKSFFGMGMGIAILVLIALTILGGVLLYQTGWSRGYATGIVTAGVQDGTLAPVSPIYPGVTSASTGALSGLGIFVMIVLGFMALGIVGRLFRMRAWHGMAGHWGAPGTAPGSHWSAHHKGHQAPWFPWCWYAAYEEKPEEGKQENQADEAGK